MSQRYVSQFDVSTDVHETDNDVVDNDKTHGNDLLAGSQPIRVIAYRAETPLSTVSTGTSNYTVELHIGEREKIGQGTFGYWNVAR